TFALGSLKTPLIASMPLPSFFQRFTRRDTGPSVQAPPLSQTEIDQVRVRARRRMIGMAVLVVAGVIGFPWLFETQPRPMPSDVVVVSKAASSGVRGVRSAPVEPEVSAVDVPPVVARALDAERSAAVAKAPAAERRNPEPQEEFIEDEAPVRKVTPPAPKPAPVVRPPTKPAAPPPAPDAEGARYIIQVGAFSDAATARAARLKLERLGVKTYTQAVETPA